MIIIGFGSVALRPFRNLIERKSMSQTLAPKKNCSEMGLMPVCSQLCQTWTPFVNRESFLSFPDSARTRGVGGKQGRTLKETFEDWTDRCSFSQRAKSIIPWAFNRTEIKFFEAY